MTRHATSAATAMLLATLAVCGYAQSGPSRFGRAEAEHLLNRAGFGGTPEDIARLVAMGATGAMDSLVNASAEHSGSGMAPFIARTLIKRDEEFRRLDADARRRANAEMRRADQGQVLDFRNWWIDRMVRTPAPLEEKMTLFWAGYFTSSQRDVRNSVHMIQQNQTLREHALGSFRLMLHEIARDPAMLEYLDNNRNRKGKPNENFAREVMELFTLGLGHYTEEDIREAARAFTGWTFIGDRFVLNDRQHDFGEKVVLGRKGRWNGDQVLDILLDQKAAPRFVATRLLGFFVTATPPEAMVNRYAALLRKHNWEIRPVMRALFLDPEFYSEQYACSRILGPIEYAVSVARKLPGSRKPPAAMLATACDALGQSLLAPPNVKGWEGGEAWITTATLLDRGNLALAIVEGRDRPRWRPKLDLAGFLEKRDATTPERVVDVLCDHFLSVPVSDEARTTLVTFLKDDLSEGETFALDGILAGRRLVKLAHLILSLPEAQLA